MNDEAVVADSETNTSVPSETDSSGKGVYNIYPAHGDFAMNHFKQWADANI